MPAEDSLLPLDQLTKLLAYFERYEKDARKASLEVFQADGCPMLPRFASATWLRVPNLLRALIALAPHELDLEVETLVRVMLELAIVALWVGVDEERARATRDETLRKMQKGHERLKRMGIEPSEPAQFVIREWLKSSTGRSMPSLEVCSEQVLDTPRIPDAKRMAVGFYRAFYDAYSVASHGELRAAEKLARGVPKAEVQSALLDAVMASAAILMAVGGVLGRDAEIERLLHEVLIA